MNIGLGTAALGRPEYINLRQEQKANIALEAFKEKGIETLDSAYALGIRYFDTAPGYGMAEQLLHHWITQKQYEDVEIASKWGYTYVANFDPKATVHEIKEHSLSKLQEQWAASKLLLPYLSSYQIHSATLDSGIFENQAALDYLAELKATYKLQIGITSSGDKQSEIVERALEIHKNGLPLFDSFQITYNIIEQSMGPLIHTLNTNKKRVVIKEALANGRVFRNVSMPQYTPIYNLLDQLANKYEVGTDAIAIAFCLQSVSPFMVLSGASNSKHLTNNLLALSTILTKEEISQMQSLSSTPSQYWHERKQMAWN